MLNEEVFYTMSFVAKKPFLLIGLLFLLLVALPATIFIFQRQQESRSHAAKTAALSFTPATSQANPLLVQNGTFSMDVMLTPGDNLVSLVRLDITYNPQQVQPVNTAALQINSTAFPQVVNGPTYTTGEITETVSIGSNLVKAIQQPTKVGTITFKVLPGVTADPEEPIAINFGQNTQVIALSSTSSPTQNVSASTLSGYVITTQGSSTMTSAAIAAVTPTPTTPPAAKVCTNNPSDDMLIIDRSGSMKATVGSTTKIAGAKQAATNFVDIVSKDTRNMVGLVSFATTATLNNALSTNYSAVKTQISGLAPNGSTCTQCAIDKANQEIAAHGRPSMKHVVVLLTDGIANYIEGGTQQTTAAIAEQKALDAAKSGHTANGTVFYTIGLGNNVNTAFLQQIASVTGGKYYFSPTSDQLNNIYTQISQEIAKASVTGFVFNDANANGAYDQNESKLSGWTVQLTGSGASQSAVTDSTGTYSLSSLCDGSYTVKEKLQSPWRQTLPTSQSYNVTIANGNNVTGKNFGNARPRCSDTIDNDNNGFADAKDSTCHTDGNPANPKSYDPNKDGEHGGNTCADSKDNNGNGLIDGADPICHTGGDPKNPWDPNLPELSPTPTPTLTPTPKPTRTPTPTPNDTTIFITTYLHGIGASGDNANPDTNSLSNKNPQHTTRPVLVSVYNAANILTATAPATLTYNTTNGNYVAKVDLGNGIDSGSYTVKVQVNQHLTRAIAGIQTLETGKENTLPSVALVTGDINNDNHLNILDYNLLLDCYSDIQAAPACDNNAKKLASDINDDGAVNQFDYNLFLREISTQLGD